MGGIIPVYGLKIKSYLMKSKPVLTSGCGTVVNKERMHTFDGHMLYGKCLKRLTAACDDCGRRIWRAEAECAGYAGLSPSAYHYIYTQ